MSDQKKFANLRIARFFDRIAHFFAKNERFAQKTDEQIPSPDTHYAIVCVYFNWVNMCYCVCVLLLCTHYVIMFVDSNCVHTK